MTRVRGAAPLPSAITPIKPTPRTQAVQPARAPRAVSAPDGQGDPHRRRLGEGERHHEGHGGELQGDGMGGERGGAEPAQQ